MYYYWLIPIFVVALVALGIYFSAWKKKIESGSGPTEAPEPIRRGRFLNK